MSVQCGAGNSAPRGVGARGWQVSPVAAQSARRGGDGHGMGVHVRRHAGMEIDLHRLRVTVDGRAIRLVGLQLKLLLHLLAHPERVFSREQLLDAVWPSGHESHPQNVDVAVCRLRKALGDAGRLIESVRYFGYRLGSSSVDRETAENDLD